MFTGLVEEVGTVGEFRKVSREALLTIRCNKVTEGTIVGDSISVNGVCLTVVKITGDLLAFDVSFETLKRTNIGSLKVGDKVNLERALQVGARLGGHIVQGHVDTTTKVLSIKREQKGFTFQFQLPQKFKHLIVEKGSVGIDGISLTVAEITGSSFSVAVIPHTYENTNLKFRKPGDTVNVEFDIIGKYVEALVKNFKR